MATNARAQIVNTEPLFRAGEDRPWKVTAEGNLDLRRGNTELLVLGVLAGGRYYSAPHEFLLSAAHDRSTEAYEQIANKSFAHARYRYWFSERLQLEAFAQTAQDEFRLLSARHLVGAGPRVVWFKAGGFQWALAASYMFEHEELAANADFPQGVTRDTHRLNLTSGPRLDHEDFTARQTVFVQPALDDFSNVRVLHQFEVSLHVKEFLSVRWSLEQALDTIAPSDVAPLDTTLKVGVKLDWSSEG